MTIKKDYKKNNKISIIFVLIILWFVFIFCRLFFLSSTFLLHDERDIILTGYSLAKTGKDLYGNFLPVRFENISPSNPLFAIYYSALWHLIFPKTVFFGRLAYVFISSFLLPLIYILILKITKNQKVSFLTSIVCCFSPWIFHITRLALEIPLALTTIFLAIIFYLNEKIILAYFLFFISSFTYQGYKILIPFILFYLELPPLLIKRVVFDKKVIARNLINLIFIGFIFFTTFFVDRNTALKRKNEFIFLNKQELEKIVNFKRESSSAGLSTSRYFDNKLTIIINHFLKGVAFNYDISYLFVKGDPNAMNSHISGGQFFQISLIFYFLGLLYLGKNGKKEDFFIVGLTLIGIIPALVKIDETPSFSIRGSLSIVGFGYLFSLGIIYYLNLIKKLSYRKPLNFIILVILIFNIIGFTYNYFFRRPILICELFNENERQLVNFINENSKKKINIYHNNPKDLYLSLIFLKNNGNKLSFFQKNLQNNPPYHWKNYSFYQCQNNTNYLQEKNSIIYEGCLDENQYKELQEKIPNKIFYKDFYSKRTAYFINY